MAESTQTSRLDQLNHADLLQTSRRLLAEMQALSSRIAAAQEIATAINRSLDLEEILQIVGRQAKWLLDFDHCSVCIAEKDQPNRFITLFGPEIDRDILEAGQAGLIQKSLRTKQSQLVRDSGTAAEAKAARFRSQIIIPLESEGEVLGTINFAAHETQAYTQEDLRIGYLLALQLAAAIRNASRFAEINQLYSVLEEAYADLMRAEQLRQDMTHMIVHDLRNPLNVILGMVEMAEYFHEEQPHPEKVAECLTDAYSTGQRMVGLITDILNVSKFEAGELSLDLAPVSLAELLQRQKSSYQIQADAESKQLIIEAPAALPLVTGDAGIIRRVIDNLVGNAFKYTRSGGVITLSVSQTDQALRVTVQDDGEGIPPEHHQRIFEKYAQVKDERGQPLRKGTGLGLAFCQLAVQAHGGDIWVESEVGQGSRFIFTLPLKPAAAPL